MSGGTILLAYLIRIFVYYERRTLTCNSPPSWLCILVFYSPTVLDVLNAVSANIAGLVVMLFIAVVNSSLRSRRALLYIEMLTVLAKLQKREVTLVTVRKLPVCYLYEMSQLMEGKCFRWASFLSSPQNTCTIPRVAAVTGSEKSPPGGDTAPTMDTDPGGWPII
ncbi:unnamed protein product [Leptidea sinapis]|uniref:Uncharacterized protein n=1 Tax=Leptidea sinapis TaxID=189913 RepID=A0A5E4PV23_9NEOP|nr:unnamed protein product [Leptidea sinapis]